MDEELSRIAAEVLRPGEQLRWAGKPLNSGPLQFPTYFKTVFGGFLLLPVGLFAISSDHDPSIIVINLVPILFVFGLITLIFAKLHTKYARPEHNTFLLTRHRAIHVFSHNQISRVDSIPLDASTTISLYPGRSGAGDLMIRRKPNQNEADAWVALFLLRRSMWAGIRFNSLQQAEYVRDVATWVIAQNSAPST